MEGDFDSGPPLRQYDSRPLAGPPIVPLLLTVGPADRQVQSTRRPGPILESASLFLPLAALRRIPRKRLACSATGGAAPLSPILDFTPGEMEGWCSPGPLPLTTHGAAAEREAEPIRLEPRLCIQRTNMRHKRCLTAAFQRTRMKPGKSAQTLLATVRILQLDP